MHPGDYIAGIDFYCDGAASKSKRIHSRAVVGRYRHSTCEKWDGFDGGKMWMQPLANGTVGEDGHRYRMVCSKCGADIEVKRERLEQMMLEIWERHAIKVRRVNVTELLTS